MLLQSLPLNAYDCIHVNRDLVKAPNRPMFVGGHIGDRFKTNLVVPSQLHSEWHCHIENWYARTNIPDSPALRSWASTAQVSLFLNGSPVMGLPLSDLLQRKYGQVGLVGVLSADEIKSSWSHVDTAAAQIRNVAERLYRLESGYVCDFSLAPATVQNAYLRMAALARNAFCAAPAIVVPPRARVEAWVHGNGPANGAFLETMPAVAPMALVWLHLEGHQESSSAD